MRIVIDIDGTICTEEKRFSRCLAKPLNEAVSSINSLYDEGHEIILWSARGWEELEMTKDWLSRAGVKYSMLMLGKINYDLWVDDRAIKFDNWKGTIEAIKKNV